MAETIGGENPQPLESATIKEQPKAAEAGDKGKETGDSREKVLGTFNTVVGMMKAEQPDKLTPDDRASLRLIEEARKKTIDQGRDTYVNSFPGSDNRGSFVTEEGVPVDGLMSYLTRKKETEQFTPEKLAELKDLYITLSRNSREYFDAPSRTQPGQIVGRVRQEAEIISHDDDRKKGSGGDNYIQAHKDLQRRRELVLPPKDEAAPIENVGNVIPAPVQPTEGAGNQGDKSGNIKKEDHSDGLQSQEQIDIVFANRGAEIRGRARDIVEKMFRYKMREGSKWNPKAIFRRMGLHMFEEGYKQRWIQNVEAAMIANNNSALEWDFAKNELKDANARRADEKASGQAAIERVKEGNLIAGEKKVELQGPLRDVVMNEIIKPIINGESGKDEKWIQEKLREFVKNNADNPDVQSVFGSDATKYGNVADYFATDILELGNQIRDDISASKYSLEQFDKNAHIHLANTRWAAETDAKFNNVDKFIAWTQKSKWGHVFTPAAIGALASVGTFALMRAPSSALRMADFAAPLVGSLAGGSIAAIRRYSEEKKDMATHQRERAYGEEVPDGTDAQKREALEKYSYDVATVAELRNGGGKDAVTVKDKSIDRLSIADLLKNFESDKKDENRQAITSRIAEITARLDFSALNKVDLVRFEGEFKTEQGRLELMRTVCELKLALKKAGVTKKDLDDEIGDYNKLWKEHFAQNTEQKDKEFKRYRLRQSMKSFVWGMAIGGATSLLTQEALALGSRGLGIEAGSGPTIIEKMAGLDWAPEPKGLGAAMVIEELTKNGKADFGNISAHMDGGKVVIDSISGKAYTGASPEITIDTASKTLHIVGDLTDPKFNNLDDEFKAAGFGITIDSGVSTGPKSIDAKTFLADARGKVDHTEWYGYDTGPSDLHELQDHNWKTGDGNGVVFSSTSMTGDSMQTGNTPESVHVPDFIKEGKGVRSFWTQGQLNEAIYVKVPTNGLLELNKSADPSRMVEVFKNGTWVKMPERSIANLVLGDLSNFSKDSDYTHHYEILNFKSSMGGLFEKDGKTHFGSFSTIKGTGHMPDTIPGFGPQPESVLTPPILPDEIKTAPPIAIPEAPRKLMEEMQKKKGEEKTDIKPEESPGPKPDIADNLPRQLTYERPQYGGLLTYQPAEQRPEETAKPTGLLTDQRPKLKQLEDMRGVIGPEGSEAKRKIIELIKNRKGNIGNALLAIDDQNNIKIEQIGETPYSDEQPDLKFDGHIFTISEKYLGKPYIMDILHNLDIGGYVVASGPVDNKPETARPTDQRPEDVKPIEQPVNPDIGQTGGQEIKAVLGGTEVPVDKVEFKMTGSTFQDFIDTGNGTLGDITAHVENDGTLRVDKIGEDNYGGNQMDIRVDKATKTVRSKGPMSEPPFTDLDKVFREAGFRVIEEL